MRDLPTLWRSNTASHGPAVAFGYDERNTIMVDDSWTKMREYAGNAVIIPEYDEERAAAQDEEEKRILTDVLGFLQTTLGVFVEGGDVTDVRDVVAHVKANL